jgi:hypothetical protein
MDLAPNLIQHQLRDDGCDYHGWKVAVHPDPFKGSHGGRAAITHQNGSSSGESGESDES